jgi:hypothetical protein
MFLIGVLLVVSCNADEDTGATALQVVKSICVANIVGDDGLLDVAREMTFASLFVSGRFTVTEKCELADAVIKGAVIERIERRSRSESESLGFGIGASASESDRTGRSSASVTGRGATGESLSSSDTKVTASVALRLVDRHGTIIWAYTHDSAGGKARSALSEAMDRAIKRLLREFERK